MDPADQTMSKRISILTRLYKQHRLSHSLFYLCLPVNDIPWCPYFTRLMPLCLPSLSQHLRFVQAQSPPHPFSPLPCLNCISPSFDSLRPLSFSSITVSLSKSQPSSSSTSLKQSTLITSEHSKEKMAAGPVFSNGSIRHLQRRRRKESVFLCLRWNFQPNKEAYSQPSRSDSSGRCCRRVSTHRKRQMYIIELDYIKVLFSLCVFCMILTSGAQCNKKKDK